MATIYLRVTSSRIVGELNRKRRRIPVLADHFHQPAISPQVSLKRATTRIGRVNVIVRRQVHGPGSLNSNPQRFVAAHSQLQLFYFNTASAQKLPLYPAAMVFPNGTCDMLTPMRSSPHELRPSMRSVDARAFLYDF
jgi:hypothetical protein